MASHLSSLLINLHLHRHTGCGELLGKYYSFCRHSVSKKLQLEFAKLWLGLRRFERKVQIQVLVSNGQNDITNHKYWANSTPQVYIVCSLQWIWVNIPTQQLLQLQFWPNSILLNQILMKYGADLLKPTFFIWAVWLRSVKCHILEQNLCFKKLWFDTTNVIVFKPKAQLLLVCQ